MSAFRSSIRSLVAPAGRPAEGGDEIPEKTSELDTTRLFFPESHPHPSAREARAHQRPRKPSI